MGRHSTQSQPRFVCGYQGEIDYEWRGISYHRTTAYTAQQLRREALVAIRSAGGGRLVDWRVVFHWDHDWFLQVLYRAKDGTIKLTSMAI